MLELIHNRILLFALAGNLVAQVLKLLIHWISEREFNLKRMVEAGGMPSSHSATVSALATGVWIEYGPGSPHFAIAAIFAFIVLWDAAGVRSAAGKHAEILNVLKRDLQHLLSKNFENVNLKTLLGHTKFQVFSGVVTGILTTLMFYWLSGFWKE